MSARIMRFITGIAIIALLVSGSGCAFFKEEGVSLATSSKKVTVVDFSVKTKIPLLKRQNTFSPSHSFTGGYGMEFMRDVRLLPELASENMRIDLFMGNGGVGAGIGQGTADKLVNSFANTDLVFKQLYKNGTSPYVSYFATPNALYDTSRGKTNYWKYPPSDYDAWKQVCYDIAKHYAEKGWPLAANEVWNEPDWYDSSVEAMAFYEGTWEEYLKIYDYAVRGIREANPFASVGGMSLATITDYILNGNVDQFLTYIIDKKLPLDFISYHSYGPRNYTVFTEATIKALQKYGEDLATVGMHLNEFHVQFEKPHTYECVPAMLEAVNYFLKRPQITNVNWACFREVSEGLGYIDSRTGKRYAPYYALMLYNNMPIDRVSLDTKGYIAGFASVNDIKGGVLLYNKDRIKKSVTVSLQNLPFKKCNIKVYAIDAQHSNYYDNREIDELSCIYSADKVSTKNLSYDLALAPLGTYYIELTDASASRQELQPEAVCSLDGSNHVISGGVATVLKKEYYFANRSKNTFSEFDLRTFTAYAGMGDNNTGIGLGGVVLDNVPDTLNVTMEAWGPIKASSENAALILKVDYLNQAGESGKSVVYHTKQFSAVPSIPWSSDTFETAIVKLNQSFELKIVESAPIDFSGKIILSYGVVDLGADTTLKIRFKKASDSKEYFHEPYYC